VAQCSKAQAIAITVFVVTMLFLTALAAAFIRPFHDCALEDLPLLHSDSKEVEPEATNGETFPWDDVRLPKFITPIRYDIELTPNLTTKMVTGEKTSIPSRFNGICTQKL
jgi:hypothetical protein